MRQASRRRGQLSDDSRTEIAQRIIDFLQARYRSKTAENVAADTGIPAETVQKMIDRRSAPSVFNYTRLWFAYGPEFLVAVHPGAPKWLDRVHREEEQERIRAEIAALEARLERSS